jgi:hypothetical protein
MRNLNTPSRYLVSLGLGLGLGLELGLEQSCNLSFCNHRPNLLLKKVTILCKYVHCIPVCVNLRIT